LNNSINFTPKFTYDVLLSTVILFRSVFVIFKVQIEEKEQFFIEWQQR
jgi:hypothetical protein